MIGSFILEQTHEQLLLAGMRYSRRAEELEKGQMNITSPPKYLTLYDQIICKSTM